MNNYLFLAFLLLSNFGFCQWDTKDAAQFQKELNEWYANPETTALSKEELSHFSELNFFPISDQYIVQASFTPVKKHKAKKLNTSKGGTRKLMEYGTLSFELQGKKVDLLVLKNMQVSKPEYADYLTIAFRDETSGEETYGGGRYLGVREHELSSGTYLLNFNLAYNPSCAYSERYNCIVPPRKNYIPIRIEAGTKLGFKTKN